MAILYMVDSRGGTAEEVRKQIALTDEQRESVRRMLAKFGGQIDEDKDADVKKAVGGEEEEIDEPFEKREP